MVFNHSNWKVMNTSIIQASVKLKNPHIPQPDLLLWILNSLYSWTKRLTISFPDHTTSGLHHICTSPDFLQCPVYEGAVSLLFYLEQTRTDFFFLFVGKKQLPLFVFGEQCLWCCWRRQRSGKQQGCGVSGVSWLQAWPKLPSEG